MVQISVKTLDSKIHAFDVSPQMTVKDFKEHIAAAVYLSAEKQRFILKGRVLQDDKRLEEYDLAGSTIHVLQKISDAGAAGEPSTSAAFNPILSGPGGSGTGKPLITQQVQNMDLDDEDTSLSDVLKHVPEEWMDILQLDVRRQLGMPAQMPFSDGFVKLFTRSSNNS